MKFQSLLKEIRDMQWIGNQIGAALESTGSYRDFYIWIGSQVLIPVSLLSSRRANIDNPINLIVE
jgi:hypothetical protein